MYKVSVVQVALFSLISNTIMAPGLCTYEVLHKTRQHDLLLPHSPPHCFIYSQVIKPCQQASILQSLWDQRSQIFLVKFLQILKLLSELSSLFCFEISDTFFGAWAICLLKRYQDETVSKVPSGLVSCIGGGGSFISSTSSTKGSCLLWLMTFQYYSLRLQET